MKLRYNLALKCLVNKTFFYLIQNSAKNGDSCAVNCLALDLVLETMDTWPSNTVQCWCVALSQWHDTQTKDLKQHTKCTGSCMPIAQIMIHQHLSHQVSGLGVYYLSSYDDIHFLKFFRSLKSFPCTPLILLSVISCTYTLNITVK